MKILFFIFIFFIIISCSTNKKVYWCGDHPCINKKEREAYFKKTMIVEIKNLKDRDYKDDSKLEKIIKESKSKKQNIVKDEKDLIKQAKLEEKKLAKQIKLEEKRRIKEEKKLAKQIKLEEKKRIKEEKKLAKQIKLEEKAKIKNKKKLSKKNVELDDNMTSSEIRSRKFSELVEKITKRNILRSYPDINDIPN
tara:strand:+ start:4997 stop:5578 length:582 start_codon:yes stop_codon:yes gene_type:complete